MTDDERRTLEAAKALVRAIRAYNALVDRPGFTGEDCSGLEYVQAANAMEAAEDALVEAATSLLDEAGDLIS